MGLTSVCCYFKRIPSEVGFTPSCRLEIAVLPTSLRTFKYAIPCQGICEIGPLINSLVGLLFLHIPTHQPLASLSNWKLWSIISTSRKWMEHHPSLYISEFHLQRCRKVRRFANRKDQILHVEIMFCMSLDTGNYQHTVHKSQLNACPHRQSFSINGLPVVTTGTRQSRPGP